MDKLKLKLFALSLFLILNSVLTAQDMSIDETISYINNQLRENSYTQQKVALTDAFGHFNIFNEIDVSNDGKLVIAAVNSKNELVSYQEAFIEDLDLSTVRINSLSKMNNIKVDCNSSSCVKNKHYSYSQDYYRQMTLRFNYNTRVGEKLKNALYYLIQIAQIEQQRKLAEDDDPFANPISSSQLDNSNSDGSNSNFIQMTKMPDGTYEIPVVLNGVLKINFILDSGASEVFISPDVALTLMKTGTVKETDFIGSQQYVFADGSSSTSKRFVINKLQLGSQTINNVTVGISNSIDAPMLLGQNVLNKFGSVTIDYTNHTLFIQNK